MTYYWDTWKDEHIAWTKREAIAALTAVREKLFEAGTDWSGCHKVDYAIEQLQQDEACWFPEVSAELWVDDGTMWGTKISIYYRPVPAGDNSDGGRMYDAKVTVNHSSARETLAQAEVFAEARLRAVKVARYLETRMKVIHGYLNARIRSNLLQDEEKVAEKVRESTARHYLENTLREYVNKLHPMPKEGEKVMKVPDLKKRKAYQRKVGKATDFYKKYLRPRTTRHSGSMDTDSATRSHLRLLLNAGVLEDMTHASGGQTSFTLCAAARESNRQHAADKAAHAVCLALEGE